MPPRKEFHQIMTVDPPAVDVVRDDFVIERHEDDDCLFRWEKTTGKYEIIKGTILHSGLKKDMLARHVNAAGELVNEGWLLKRKTEIEKQRMLQVNAEKITLQKTAEQLFDEGADAVAEQAQPVIKVQKRYSPRQMNSDEKERLKEELLKIGCEEKRSSTKLCRNYNVFVPTGKLAVALLKYRTKPGTLHQRILNLVLPEKVLRLEGISRTGKRGCVGISSDITESITLYVSAVFKAAGGKVESINYDPDAKLKNLLDNTKRRKGKIRLLPIGGHGSASSPHTSPLTSPHTSPPTSPHTSPPTSPPHIIQEATSDILGDSAGFTPLNNTKFMTSHASNSQYAPPRDHDGYTYTSPKVYTNLLPASPSSEVTLPFANY